VRADPLEEQILAACVTRLAQLAQVVDEPWYAPRFVERIYRSLDEVNEFPGYLVFDAPEESGAELQTLDTPDSTVIASMGITVVAYGLGSDAVPTNRVLIRLLADAERALCAPDLLAAMPFPDNQLDIQNTRRVLDHQTEAGPPWRSLRSHLYRVRYIYTRGYP
jgi:hypothetical protein